MKLDKWAYSPREVSDNLGLSLNTVYSMIKDGRLDSVKLPRRILIPASSIEAFLQNAVRGGVTR